MFAALCLLHFTHEKKENMSESVHTVLSISLSEKDNVTKQISIHLSSTVTHVFVTVLTQEVFVIL